MGIFVARSSMNLTIMSGFVVCVVLITEPVQAYGIIMDP